MSQNKWEERAKKMQDVGNKMEKLGKKLTLLFTLPIILLFIFGIPGLIIGIVIAVIGIGSMNKKSKQEEQEQFKEDYTKGQTKSKDTQ
jgi:uncharacterized membrane protein